MIECASVVSKRFCLKGHDKDLLGRLEKGRCAECKRIAMRSPQRKATKKLWQQNNPYRVRPHYRQYKWKSRGIVNANGEPFTFIDFDRLYQIQQGRCKICKNHQSDLQSSLHVDHDHKTGLVRSLLCAGCNYFVGIIENRRMKIETTLQYLDDVKGII